MSTQNIRQNLNNRRHVAWKIYNWSTKSKTRSRLRTMTYHLRDQDFFPDEEIEVWKLVTSELDALRKSTIRDELLEKAEQCLKSLTEPWEYGPSYRMELLLEQLDD